MRAIVGILVLFFTVSAKAQGIIYFWEWHATGVCQPFRGSFEVTEAEMQPGAVFNSDLFYSTMYFTNELSGYSFKYDAPWSSVAGHLEPFFLSMVHHDDSHSASLAVYAEGPGRQFAGVISESDPDGASWIQHGYWDYQVIPEPSVMNLCVVGTAAWFIHRKKRCGR